jgi:hypothetical protein
MGRGGRSATTRVETTVGFAAGGKRAIRSATNCAAHVALARLGQGKPANLSGIVERYIEHP